MDVGNVEVMVVEGPVVAALMFHPTTPIAPTVELLDMVVVAIDHEVESPAAVDPKVSVMPEDTSDRQFPTTSPGIPSDR